MLVVTRKKKKRGHGMIVIIAHLTKPCDSPSAVPILAHHAPKLHVVVNSLQDTIALSYWQHVLLNSLQAIPQTMSCLSTFVVVVFPNA